MSEGKLEQEHYREDENSDRVSRACSVERLIRHPRWKSSPARERLITLGDRGVLLHDGTRAFTCPAMRVTPVDTTSAGDTFIGYFIAARLRGASMSDAANLACRAAAVCVTTLGAMNSIPSLTAVQDARF